MKINRFEDLLAWQEARKLTERIYTLTNRERFSKDFGLRDQVQRASVSVMANIAEGFDAKSQSEFIHFLTYSRRSASEVQSHLYVALDQSYIFEEDFNQAYGVIHKTKNLIGGLIRYLSNRR